MEQAQCGQSGWSAEKKTLIPSRPIPKANNSVDKWDIIRFSWLFMNGIEAPGNTAVQQTALPLHSFKVCRSMINSRFCMDFSPLCVSSETSGFLLWSYKCKSIQGKKRKDMSNPIRELTVTIIQREGLFTGLLQIFTRVCVLTHSGQADHLMLRLKPKTYVTYRLCKYRLFMTAQSRKDWTSLTF